MMEKEELKLTLRQLARKYETADFIKGDPSWFMHQVSGRENQETIGFVASVLSYGRRDLFMPKIQSLLDMSGGEPHDWIAKGNYRHDIADDTACFYRLYNNHMMLGLLDGLRDIVGKYGSLGEFAKESARNSTALEVLEAFALFFQRRGIRGMVPSPRTSVAKRPCMFMRWMVRDGSPVDLGLWSDFIDKRSLFIPMDTHVMQEARKLGLITGKTASWNTVVRLTEALREVFPDDPVRGDFALFGVGVGATA